MEYKVKTIKNGIDLHKINIDKFKTDLVSVFLTTDLNEQDVTKNALISLILRRGSNLMPSQEQICKELENLYGATFDCGLDKTGDNQVLKFYIETINNDFLPQNDINMWKESIVRILDIVFNPYIENDEFKKEYVEQEKKTLKQLIEGRKDNKARYAIDRCIEEVYKGEKFGIFKYGNIQDLEKIDSKSLYEYYKKFINKCKIDIFVSGNLNEDIDTIISENENIRNLSEREPTFSKLKIENRKISTEEKVVFESLEVTQGKLELGLDVDIKDEDLKYDVMVYNNILGGSANSKMFQNVREKAHLAYVASSNYFRHKNNIFINCGIEINNYEKALAIVREQIEDMKKGNFSNDDLTNAKKCIVEAIKTIYDEQDSQITFYFGQELSKNNITVEDYMKRIEKVSRDDVINIAKKITINTIYFLKN